MEDTAEGKFVFHLGKFESLTSGGGKTWEDNGAQYQRG